MTPTDPHRDETALAQATLRPGPRLSRRVVQMLMLFVACVLVVDAVIGEKGLLETWRARQEMRGAEAALHHLRRENGALRERARRLREDPRAIEALAREELGLIRPGERVFIVRDVDGE